MSETVMVRGADGAEFFYTLDRVIQGLIQTLIAGRVDEAADLYSRVREDIAFQLIGKTQGTPEVFRQVANLFFRARDFQRAAYCCEQLDEQDKAAGLYEKAGDHGAAAQCYAAAGNTLKAAEMFEKGHNLVEAARLYLHQGDADHAVRAALCFEKAGRPFDAAQAWEKSGRSEKALALYQAVDDDSADKKMAVRLHKELLERSRLTRAQTGQMPAASVGGVGAVGSGGGDVVELGAADVVTPVAPDAANVAARIGGGTLDADGKNRVTLMEGFDFLKRLPLFAELSLGELKAIYHLCDVVTVGFGDKLVSAGAASPALWVILDGTVDVRSSHGREVARLAPGDHVGEMGLFDDAPAGVDVVAAAPVRALRLDKRGFAEAMAADDAFAVRVYRVLFSTLRDRLRATTNRLTAGGI